MQAAIPGLQLTADAKYARPKSGIIGMNFTPIIMEFGAGTTGIPMTLKTQITATGSTITVDSITSNDARFTVVANTTFTLQAGESRDIEVQFTPTDSGYAFANFRVNTNVCSPFFFYATGGYSDRSPIVRTLKLLAPNGGEVFGVGADTTILWEGVPPSDSIRVELSTDGGLTWIIIDRGAGGLRKLWEVGNTPSNRCLIRISQLRRSFPAPIVLAGHTDWLLSAEFNHDGTRAVTASEDHKAFIWDVASGSRLLSLENHKGIVGAAVYSPNGQTILTVSRDQSAKLWDATIGMQLMQFDSPIELSTASFGKNGAVAATGDYKGVIRLWDIQSGNELNSFSAKDDSTRVASMDISPNGNNIVSVTQSGNVTMWNVASGKRQVFPVSSSDYASTVRFSQDGNKFVTGGPNSAILWDAASMSQIRSYRVGTTKVTAAAISPDGALLATAGSNQGDSTFVSIIVWSLASGDSLYALRGHGGQINTVAFSRDGRRLISSSIDQSARVWELGSAIIIQQDTSDKVFSIIAPAPVVRPLDLGSIPIGMSRDSIFIGALQNKEILPITIDSMTISGANAGEFAVVSQKNIIIAPSRNADIEFQCKPLAVGVRTATVTFHSPSGKFTTSIQALGIQADVSVPTQVIDFGKVRVLSTKDSTIDIFLKNNTLGAITITSLRESGPDSVQFSIIAAGGSITLTAGEVKPITLRFAPIVRGRTSGSIVVEYQGVGSPMKVRLFGEGVVTELGFSTAIDIPTLTCTNDTIVNFPFQNISDAPVTIQNIEFIGTNASEFSWIGSLPSSSIPVGSSSKGAIRFIPKNAGDKNALMVLTASGFSVKSDTIALHARKDSVGFSLAGEVADSVIIRMTVSQQFVSQDTLITIINNGSIPLKWNVPFSLGNFSFVDVVPLETPVGGTSLVRVRFDGGSVGNYYAPAFPLVEKTCGRMKRFNLQANVIPSAPTSLSIGSGSAGIGEIIEIPLIISNISGLKEAKVTGIEGVIRCNGTLLLPLPPAERGIYSGDTVRVKFTAQIGTDSLLMKLRFRAALGNDTTTALVIERAAATFGNARISTSNGKFTLLGICRDGAVPRLFRLLHNSSVTLAPQPISTSGVIRYEAGEVGEVSIKLTNLLGINVMQIVKKEFTIGSHDITFSCQNLQTGVYFLSVDTPTQTLVQRLDVSK
ncbi:MAG: choice-of-anchor D domain-containing protein [Ignavibacteria bacterium]|nr:choice-of-anchor D domain-containing protein [Ignavibacteria bacterium]